MKKNKLLDLFNGLDIDGPLKQPNTHFNSKVLLVDGMNTFLRSFAAINHLNRAGNHVGGLTGFLRSIGAAIKLINPTRVVIVFDGDKGSVNRKYLYPEYKGNRNHAKVVNKNSFKHKDDEDNSKNDQIVRLVDYLRLLPVSLICIDRLEADDIIGHLSGLIYETYEDSETWIMSSDNDFLQRINDRIHVYSPTKKKNYYVDNVLFEFNIHPENFSIYKALTGDDSDNIPGVMGIGKQNVYKLFEGLSQPKRMELSDIFKVCQEKPKNSVLYDRVLEMDKMVEIFHQLVDLRNPNIDDADKEDIRRMFYTKPDKLKKYEFVKMYEADKMGDTIPYVNSWLDCFSPLNVWL